ncbi:hypothetical protein TYRP_003404 [Tyrophagus putrescentiae]|nr:hypothetical protein TYRP_003404 [Tyrophagus putrescentiae]
MKSRHLYSVFLLYFAVLAGSIYCNPYERELPPSHLIDDSPAASPPYSHDLFSSHHPASQAHFEGVLAGLVGHSGGELSHSSGGGGGDGGDRPVSFANPEALFAHKPVPVLEGHEEDDRALLVHQGGNGLHHSEPIHLTPHPEPVISHHQLQQQHDEVHLPQHVKVQHHLEEHPSPPYLHNIHPHPEPIAHLAPSPHHHLHSDPSPYVPHHEQVLSHHEPLYDKQPLPEPVHHEEIHHSQPHPEPIVHSEPSYHHFEPDHHGPIPHQREEIIHHSPLPHPEPLPEHHTVIRDQHGVPHHRGNFAPTHGFDSKEHIEHHYNPEHHAEPQYHSSPIPLQPLHQGFQGHHEKQIQHHPLPHPEPPQPHHFPGLYSDFYAHRMPGDGFGPGGHFALMPKAEVKYVPILHPVPVPEPIPVDKPYPVPYDQPYPVKVDRPIAKPYISKVIQPVIHKKTIVQSHISHIEHEPPQQPYGALDYNIKKK